ncbi:hypothetical protein [Cetobacterium somerae]|uniref:hypothetical protein n=1 Tax=Cetobacterium somerae TaxID=188913 RepID=UPI00248DCC58|nr:hypothetical protein [Cetobacterium somerae]
MSTYQTWWSSDENEVNFGLRTGFYESAIALIDKMIESESYKERDTFYFPINFLYAHAMELHLKELIMDLTGELVQGHDLKVLWDNLMVQFKLFLEDIGEDIDNKMSHLKILENEANNLSRDSIAFRYLMDKNGFYFNTEFEGDYESLKKQMEKCHTLLEGLSIFIHQRTQFLKEYESYLSDYY